ncbi:ATP-binding protein [Salinivibrio sp. ES.052]|uniref:AAA family ATPase n=1 Tax=Salinivibrio sp. ES.052 TaxID=1882823 RepID=UPI000926283D|nr:ATP-binding protein [Salinivibrio sp. ES.052]SIN80967.1 Predicted kinase [Salinivibrio sp. ES.052]
MKVTGTLFILCGKMGAGKSTFSQTLAKQERAMLISEDDWLAAHYGEKIQSFDDYRYYSNLIKPFIKEHVQRLLLLGVKVVMDFPANTKKQRGWLLSLCRDVGGEHTLFYLDVSDEQCLLQIGQRRISQPERAHFDTEAVFHHVTQYFEPPQGSEGLNIVRVENTNVG